jgi:hypothetical protein
VTEQGLAAKSPAVLTERPCRLTNSAARHKLGALYSSRRAPHPPWERHSSLMRRSRSAPVWVQSAVGRCPLSLRAAEGPARHHPPRPLRSGEEEK